MTTREAANSKRSSVDVAPVICTWDKWCADATNRCRTPCRATRTGYSAGDREFARACGEFVERSSSERHVRHMARSVGRARPIDEEIRYSSDISRSQYLACSRGFVW